MAVQSHRFDKRIAPHFFCATNTILGAGVDTSKNMKFYQIHVIEGQNVNVLDFCNRRICNGVISINGNNEIELRLNQNEPEIILGVHKDSNDLAPITVGGVPFVFADDQRIKLCPMEERIETVHDINALKEGNYLITK